MGRRSSVQATCCATILFACAVQSFATTYLPMSDTALVDGAAAVVEGRVLGVEAAPDEAALSYRVEIDRVLSGDVAGGTILVRVPGGPAPDGSWFRVFGAPVFAEGDSVLLMLEPRADGEYAVSQLALGAFRRLAVGERQLLVRDLSGIELLGSRDRRFAARGGASGRSQVDRPRDAEAFASWVAARAAGETAPASYFADLSTAEIASVASTLRTRRAATAAPERDRGAATILAAADGLPVRWFDFDSGATVELHGHRLAQNGWADGALQLERALGSWTGAHGAAVALALGDSTDAEAGLRFSDGVNTVLWNDPHDEMPGSFSCVDGGLLAIGGYWYENDIETRGDERFHRIVEGDVVVQDGAACYLTRSGGDDGAELLAHELGHVLGLGHACGESGMPSCTEERYRSALMRPVLQGGGRGPSLGADDLLGVLALYGEQGSVGGLGAFVPEGDFVLLASGGLPILLAYGMPGDLPVAGDWDGDGADTVGVFRNGLFLLHDPSVISDVAVPFGAAGDLPVVGDWDGDGVDTVGVFRNGVFWLRNSNAAGPADWGVALGASGNLPVAGDWNGDGRDEIGVFDPASGRFTLRESLAGGSSTFVIETGSRGHQPVAGDWDHDRRDTVGTFRDGVFTLLRSSSGSDTFTATLPAGSGIPVAGNWGPMR